MGYYQVSSENLLKVEAFFVRRVRETGKLSIEATVVEIAEGAEVALATAHKAIKELAFNKVIDVIKPKSRRFPITYIYKKEVEGFEATQSDAEQIKYLLSLVSTLQEDNEALNKEVKELKGQLKVANDKYNRTNASNKMEFMQ